MSKNILNLHKLDLDNEVDDEIDFNELDELDDEVDFDDFEDDGVDLEESTSEKEDQEEPVTKSSYMVRVVPKMLKYFSGPGEDYPVLGVIKHNEKLKIVEEAGSEESRWGRIDSKEQAWIPLIYCEIID